MSFSDYFANAINTYRKQVNVDFQRDAGDLRKVFNQVNASVELLLRKNKWEVVGSSKADAQMFLTSNIANDPIHHRTYNDITFYHKKYEVVIYHFQNRTSLDISIVFELESGFEVIEKIDTLGLYSILNHSGDVISSILALIQSGYFSSFQSRRDYPVISQAVTKVLIRFSHHAIAPPPALMLNQFVEFTQRITTLEKEIKKLSTPTPSKPQLPTPPDVSKLNPKVQTIVEKTFSQTDGQAHQEFTDARYTSYQECEMKSYFNETGIPIGYHADDPFKTKRIYYQGETHLITIAPTGSGKLVSVQIPTLMEYEGSMIVVDPKGECAAISVRRRKALGQKVIVINPFGILKEDFEKIGVTEFQGFNPLAFLNPDDENGNFVADVSALAESLVLGDAIGNSDPYWSNGARDLIACLIMFVCISEDEQNRHLARVREILTLPFDEEAGEGSLNEILVRISEHDFLPMAQKARRFSSDDRSNLSVISTAITNTLFIDDPKISASLTSTNGFNFKQLKEANITVYIILPAKFLLAYNRWLRLLITSALDTLMSTHEKPKQNVLFMLDEFAVLGHLTSIETAVGLARGYGIQLWMFLQDIHQLKHLYKDKAESFLANTGMQQYFVPNDLTTADMMSQRIHYRTLLKRHLKKYKQLIKI